MVDSAYSQIAKHKNIALRKDKIEQATALKSKLPANWERIVAKQIPAQISAELFITEFGDFGEFEASHWLVSA